MGLTRSFLRSFRPYQKGDAAEGRRASRGNSGIPNSVDWFADQIRPELNEIMAKRYARLFDKFVNQTDNRLQDLSQAKGRKLIIDLETPVRRTLPAPIKPPCTATRSQAASSLSSSLFSSKRFFQSSSPPPRIQSSPESTSPCELDGRLCLSRRSLPLRRTRRLAFLAMGGRRQF